MRFFRRRRRTPKDTFDERWHAWWESAGRHNVMRLLAEHRVPTDPHFKGPHWAEAEGIGDMARYGGVDAEDLHDMLAGFAEDLDGADADPERDLAAADAVARYLNDHAPT